MNIKNSCKRGQITRSALELIAERGFHNAPVAKIAEMAGVAVGTIYRYFESKDILITELHRELENKIMEVLQDGYPLGKPVRKRFLYMIRELLRYFLAQPLHFRYLEQYCNSPYGLSVHRDVLGGKSGTHNILMDIFDEGIEQQVLKELPKPVLCSLAFGPMIPLMRDHILGLIILDEVLIKQITEACWDAIKR